MAPVSFINRLLLTEFLSPVSFMLEVYFLRRHHMVRARGQSHHFFLEKERCHEENVGCRVRSARDDDAPAKRAGPRHRARSGRDRPRRFGRRPPRRERRHQVAQVGEAPAGCQANARGRRELFCPRLPPEIKPILLEWVLFFIKCSHIKKAPVAILSCHKSALCQP